jgi:protein-disulfide isomerase
VKTLLTLALSLVVCAPAFAIDVDPKIDRAVQELVPVCAGDAKIQYEKLEMKLPPRFSGVFVTRQSERSQCAATYIAVLAPSGAVFVGNPWPIADEEGKTVEEKLKNFTWRNLHENMTATIENTRNSDGLFPGMLNQATENGKMPLAGLIGDDGRIFFFGRFRPSGADVRTSRAKVFDSFVANSPTKGASNPAVTILEFSDFQCPSCQRAAGYLDPILEKHGDKVRYVRFDLPLTGHTWAFGAALAGRAIYRQNPEAFWAYKKQVYSNQSSLNPFIFWDWARDFAKDHDLDLAKYDADLANADIKAELLNGAGTALSNDIRATPSYMVNGALVDPGDDGKALAEYVEKLLSR